MDIQEFFGAAAARFHRYFFHGWSSLLAGCGECRPKACSLLRSLLPLAFTEEENLTKYHSFDVYGISWKEFVSVDMVSGQDEKKRTRDFADTTFCGICEISSSFFLILPID